MTGPYLQLIHGRDLLADLRALSPNRPVTWSEAHSIAERQAGLLLSRSNVYEPPMPQFVISSLPGIVVEWRPDWPTEGTSIQTATHWQIVIRSSDARQRQRFSLAHELKHVLDRPVIDRLHAHLDPSQQHERTERLCNFFAACLLMPRPWIKRDWYGGMRNVSELARRYNVSTQAMSMRLSELGLTDMTLAPLGR
jgi:predicted transcriptional regulator